MTGTNSITDTAPPLAHAVGGSLGSALALLLLYPLERARVELQTTQGSGNNNSSSNNNHVSSSSALPPPQDINDKVKPLQAVEQQSTSRSRGGASTNDSTTELSTSTRKAKDKEQTRKEVNDKRDEENQKSHAYSLWQGTTMSPAASWESLETSTLKQQQKGNNDKLGLIACLCQLHRRKQLYQGVTPVVTTLAVSNFVFFYCHSFLKQLLLPSTSPQKRGPGSSNSSSSTLHLSLLASCLAGIVNVLLTNPLWVANLRIVTAGNNNDNQQQPHQNLWREIKEIIHTEGWEHLWNGTPASLLLVSNPVIQFVAYEHLKNRLLSIIYQKKHMNGGTVGGIKRSSLKPLEAFILGAISKALSTVLTYPLQLAQTVLRVQKRGLQKALSANEETENGDVGLNATGKETASADEASKNQHTTATYRSTLDCLLKIYQLKGIEGWFAGMRTKLLQTVLTAAFTFLTYEQIIRVIMTVHQGLLDKRHRKQIFP